MYNITMEVSQMRTIFRRQLSTTILVAIIVTGVLGLFIPAPLLARFGTDAALDDSRKLCFDETGFCVDSIFLDYFEANGELEIFGYPISSSYNENGILVQYFQKARIEWHAFNSEPYQVQLGLLGDELGLRKNPVAPPISAGKVYFAETGHVVTYMFLRYFRAHGGLDIFRYPISEMLNENQKVVQYFQRLKLIWDPATAQMTVGNLGEIYVNAHRGSIPFDVLEPLDFIFDNQGEQNLRVVVGVLNSMAGPDVGQRVTVVVLDKRLNEPVPDATVKLTVSDGAGQELSELTQVLKTDSNGRLEAVVSLDGVRPGTWLVLQAEAALGTAREVQKEFFLVWW
jgi:5-hydroxyisourate hydrolase-like protein (transthyretin family)